MINPNFLNQMKVILQEDYDEFIKTINDEPLRGFRVNNLRIHDEELFSLLDFPAKKSQFSKNGYYLPQNYQLKNSLAYIAGLFYVQEPSASSAVTILNPKPGMKVLDLCAAPGSKSTQIAEFLRQEGLLVANEINSKRALILAENLERHGVLNSYVLNADTKEIAKAFPNFFDMVLCDAPCSGEGMFRKEKQAIEQWSLENIQACAIRQKYILENAYICLKPGGTLVYSTCTFNRVENEDVIESFLELHPDMQISKANASFGRNGLSEVTKDAIRIFPQDGGEGHFICKMIKEDKDYSEFHPKLLKSDSIPEYVQEFIKEHLQTTFKHVFIKANRVYASNYPFLSCGKCRMIREGAMIGMIKNDRFEPEHAFFTIANAEYKHTIELNDSQIKSFVSGETLNLQYPKGYYAVCWHGHSFGFVKSDGMILKNKFPKEYRIR